jgi:phytanoyl-CoA hydroxylase
MNVASPRRCGAKSCSFFDGGRQRIEYLHSGTLGCDAEQERRKAVPTLLPSETLEAYDRDGFVNAGRLLDEADVKELQAELERHIDSSFRGKESGVPPAALTFNLAVRPEDSVYQLTTIWMRSEAFGRLVRHPKITQAGAELARSNILQVWSDQVMYKPPNRGGTINWHQDAPYFPAISPSLALTAWVSLDDADVETGCMWMVPGSYRWGVQEKHLWAYKPSQIEVADFERLEAPEGLPEVFTVWPGARPCPTRSGEVHFHHSLTWHASPANRSSRTRRGYAIHYMPDGVTFNGTSDPRIELAGISTPGTPMRAADPSWFPIVYDSTK